MLLLLFSGVFVLGDGVHEAASCGVLVGQNLLLGRGLLSGGRGFARLVHAACAYGVSAKAFVVEAWGLCAAEAEAGREDRSFQPFSGGLRPRLGHLLRGGRLLRSGRLLRRSFVHSVVFFSSRDTCTIFTRCDTCCDTGRSLGFIPSRDPLHLL
jgi:hypothetical protein